MNTIVNQENHPVPPRPGLIFDGSRRIDQALLLVFAWACHFLKASQFGLYEDDWWRIPLTADLPWARSLQIIGDFLFVNNGDGRPLHDGLIHIFSFLGWLAGGLGAMYWIAYAILATNVLMLHSLLHRLSGDRVLALAGALAFVAYPADTTRPFLTHAFGVQPSLTFLLLAFRAWLSRRPILAHLLAIGCLLTYETFYLVFAAVPLAAGHRRRLHELARHGLVVTATLIAAFVLRRLGGEARALHATLPDLAGAAAFATLMGPVTSIWQHVVGPAQILGQIAQARLPSALEWSIALCGCTAVLFWRLARQQGDAESSPPLGRLAALALLMIMLAYPTTFTTSPLIVDGRGSRVHAAAAPGAAILCGVLAALLVRTGRRIPPFGAGIATGMVAIHLSLLGAFALRNQLSYAAAWSQQQSFWKQFVQAAPPVSAGTIFLLDKLEGEHPSIQALSWSTIAVLERIYVFPNNWVTSALPSSLYRDDPSPPRVFRINAASRGRYCAGQDFLEANDSFQKELSFMVGQYAGLPQRVYGIGWSPTDNKPLTIGLPCPIRPREPPPPDPLATPLGIFPRRPMYRYLIPSN